MTPKQAQEHSHGNALAPPPLGNPPRILPRAADITLDPRDRPACRRPSARRRSVFRSRLVTVLSVPAAHSGIVPGVTLLMPLIRVAVPNTHTPISGGAGISPGNPRSSCSSVPDQDRPLAGYTRHRRVTNYAVGATHRGADSRTVEPQALRWLKAATVPGLPVGDCRVRPSTREGAARSESTVMVEADLPRVSGWP